MNIQTLEISLLNLNADIAVLRNYVQVNVNTGMTSILTLLEEMCIPLFSTAYGYKLVNKNQLSVNFPAIDLADDSQAVAIQVTANADLKKVRETLKKFKKLNEDRAKAVPPERPYEKLYIFGVQKIETNPTIPDNCELLSFEKILPVVRSQHSMAKVQEITNALRQHVDYSRIHPYSDRGCLAIILDLVDRNAIKHRMDQEGRHHNMVDGLNAISELIGKGTVDGQQRGKYLELFEDETIKKHLRSIRNEVGKIVAIANRFRDENDFAYIPHHSYAKIDGIKAKILDLANLLAKHVGIPIKLEPINVD
ncbi:SMEK domain-containing protein [Paraburkholderia bannensis]|uniref:SMEK domain-containing protein n=1 Tax=Paraburkholderia bannensis TaxID=765414 RepID=UPI002AB6194F|nr:SMEK domain-containing protein [Paraburkholderia bannensis]